MKTSKSIQRYYIRIFVLLPFVSLLATGIIMLFYHAGAPTEHEIMGKDGHFWLLTHKLLTVITTPLILLHLFLYTNWIKRFFRSKIRGKHKKANISIFVAFLLCTLTSLYSWLVFKDSNISMPLRELHNKFGILLIGLFVLHVINYRRQVFKRTKRSEIK